MNNYSLSMNHEMEFEKIGNQRLVCKQQIDLKAFSIEGLGEHEKKPQVYFQLNLFNPKANIDRTFFLDSSLHLTPDNTTLLNTIDFKNSFLAEISAIYLYYPDKKYLFIKNFIYKKDCCIVSNFLYHLYLFLESYSKISFCDYMLIPRDYIKQGNFFIEDRELENNICVEFFFKRIIPLSLNHDNIFIMYGKAPVTILTGNSTAGKTTIIDFFRKSTPDLIDYSIDHFCDKSLAKTIKNFYMNEYSSIVKFIEPKNMMNFILGDHIEKIPKEIQDDLSLLRSIYGGWKIPRSQTSYFESKLYKLPFKIWKTSRNGSPIIMDFRFLNLSEMFWNFKAPITLLWVFCPLKVLSDRLTIRNIIAENQGKLSNKRPSAILLEYVELYRKKSFPYEVTLEVLKRKVAIECFREHYPDSNEQTVEDFLKKLGFESLNTEKIEITFRHNPFLFCAERYLFIDTSLVGITELAREKISEDSQKSLLTQLLKLNSSGLLKTVYNSYSSIK